MVKVWWWPVILLELMRTEPRWSLSLHLLFVVTTCRKASVRLWKTRRYFSATLQSAWILLSNIGCNCQRHRMDECGNTVRTSATKLIRTHSLLQFAEKMQRCLWRQKNTERAHGIQTCKSWTYRGNTFKMSFNTTQAVLHHAIHSLS